jgi:hypothetical protein
LERPRIKKNKAAAGKENRNIEMTFTGTLIESLMATVERVEQRTYSDEPFFAEHRIGEPLLAEPWFASVQENADYDSKFLGVA